MVRTTSHRSKTTDLLAFLKPNERRGSKPVVCHVAEARLLPRTLSRLLLKTGDIGKIEELAAALWREDTRWRPPSPQGLVESIVLTPEAGTAEARPHARNSREPRLRIELNGNLTAILIAATSAKGRPIQAT